MDYKRAYQIVLKKVEEMERENERLEADRRKLLGACTKLLNVHGPKQGDYVDAVLYMSEVVREVAPERVIHPQSE